MRWLFIGAGNMASSLIGGLLEAGGDPSCIGVVDPDKQACEHARHALGVHGEADVVSVLAKLIPQKQTEELSLGIVIAVKPHIVKTVCQSLRLHYDNYTGSSATPISTVFVSVAAGVRIDSMQAWLPENASLVRCMPNTPALLGLGATALYANSLCTAEDKVHATQLLDSAGKTLWVDDENQLDAVTALSGSGPAYFFYLIEHMTKAGRDLGLPTETAESLAIETAFGAASMARSRQHSPAVLRENVTSKGGTTAAALQIFDNNNTPDIIHAAMQAAYARAVEMGEEFAGSTESFHA
jgi:pyrroline-5-carboxylate reductase